MASTLNQTITETGIEQGDLVKYLGNVRDVVNELQADHATTKTAVDGGKTVVDELVDDHATFKTVVTDLKTLLNQIQAHMGYRIAGNPAFAIRANFDVQNANAISYFNGGICKTLAATQAFDTGTAATFPAGKWGAAVLSIDSSGNPAVTWVTASGAGYNSEALAIAAMTDPGATYTLCGYITVQAAAGNSFTAGTDALATGTGGNVAQATNYYNTSNPNSLRMGAAVSTSAPATLTASKATAGPATLTNSTALKLTAG